MTGKTLIHRAIDFEGPARIPRSSPRPERADSDSLRLFVGRPEGFVPACPGADEWGCVKEKNIGGHAGYPTVNPLSDWARWDDYRFPAPYANGRFTHLKRRIESGDPLLRDKFVYMGIGPGPIECCGFLLGFEPFLFTLAAHPERIQLIVAEHHRYMLGLVEQIAAYDLVDAVFFWDDSAMQTGPYFSMDMWRSFFKTPLRELCEAIHMAGKNVWMHSCGDLSEHIAEFHACGVDVLDNKQPLLWMNQARRYRGKLTFHSCLDYTTFIQGSDDELRGRIQDLIRSLSDPSGGFIGTLNNMIDPEVPAERVDAAWEAYRNFNWNAYPQLQENTRCT